MLSNSCIDGNEIRFGLYCAHKYRTHERCALYSFLQKLCLGLSILRHGGEWEVDGSCGLKAEGWTRGRLAVGGGSEGGWTWQFVVGYWNFQEDVAVC